MKVAIVEDDKAEQGVLKDYFARYSEQKGVEFDITVFDNALVFLDSISPRFDLVFMDIEMPMINGMDAAKRLREVDDKTILIFVTHLGQYAVKGYEVNAFDYILKPIRYSSFSMRLDRIVAQTAKLTEKYIMLPIAYGLMRLALSDLFYVEVRLHKLYFHTARGIVETRGSLAEYEDVLRQHGFIRCNKCYIINVRHIKQISEHTVTVGQDSLQISRNRAHSFEKEVKDTLASKVYNIRGDDV